MTVVSIDWDIDFKSWSFHTRYAQPRETKLLYETVTVRAKRSKAWTERQIGLWARTLGWRGSPPYSLRYRKSSGGRVHVEVNFSGHHFNDNDTFLLRYILDDDPQRIDLDLKRLERGERIERLFDTKAKDGKVRRAGPWVDW